MSLFKRAFLTITLLAVAACGFTPVYGTGGSGSALQNSIEVIEPADRDAFLVTRRLEERLGRSSDPAYKLTLSVATAEEDLAVDREGDTARFNLLGQADYALVDQSTGKTVVSGRVDNFTSYSTTGTTVATLAAQRDAQQRLMILLADMIVVRLLSADLT